MIIAGCTASVVSVPARGIRLLLSLPVFGCLLLLLLCLFVVFSTLCILCSLFFRFIWPFIDIVNVIVAIAVVVFYSLAPFFISLYSPIFCCCFLFLFLLFLFNCIFSCCCCCCCWRCISFSLLFKLFHWFFVALSHVERTCGAFFYFSSFFRHFYDVYIMTSWRGICCRWSLIENQLFAAAFRTWRKQSNSTLNLGAR